ncbi:hypothetical protein PLICRDRAFT_54740 [Plicaturopsis crispa FD-325 SS-3]|nr:hypothetical protein PLICRDRAFT_54740 [Plicaturopsis crispa FD-325 SS-3]
MASTYTRTARARTRMIEDIVLGGTAAGLATQGSIATNSAHMPASTQPPTRPPLTRQDTEPAIDDSATPLHAEGEARALTKQDTEPTLEDLLQIGGSGITSNGSSMARDDGEPATYDVPTGSQDATEDHPPSTHDIDAMSALVSQIELALAELVPTWNGATAPPPGCGTDPSTLEDPGMEVVSHAAAVAVPTPQSTAQILPGVLCQPPYAPIPPSSHTLVVHRHIRRRKCTHHEPHAPLPPCTRHLPCTRLAPDAPGQRHRTVLSRLHAAQAKRDARRNTPRPRWKPDDECWNVWGVPGVSLILHGVPVPRRWHRYLQRAVDPAAMEVDPEIWYPVQIPGTSTPSTVPTPSVPQQQPDSLHVSPDLETGMEQSIEGQSARPPSHSAERSEPPATPSLLTPAEVEPLTPSPVQSSWWDHFDTSTTARDPLQRTNIFASHDTRGDISSARVAAQPRYRTASQWSQVEDAHRGPLRLRDDALGTRVAETSSVRRMVSIVSNRVGMHKSLNTCDHRVLTSETKSYHRV